MINVNKAVYLFFLKKLVKRDGEDVTVTQTTIMVIIFWDFLMFYKIFFSLQVKRSAIILVINMAYELPHELPNELNLRKSQLHWTKA